MISAGSDELAHLEWRQAWVRREFGDGPVETANPWVRIETNDPGWAATISLAGTGMQSAEFEEVELIRSENDWLHCWVDGGISTADLEWQGRGGAANLAELIERFRSWVEAHESGSAPAPLPGPKTE